MKKILLIIFILPISTFGQVYKYNRIFNDSIVFKNFNQGFLDSQDFFIATNDYLLEDDNPRNLDLFLILEK